jgi:hypothetical protein
MTGWKRHPMGWEHPSGLVFAERGAPMADGGTNAWMVWVAAVEGEVEADRWGATVVKPQPQGSFVDPVRRFNAIATADRLADDDDSPWFVHRNDAGSLAEAKVTAEYRLARRVEPDTKET